MKRPHATPVKVIIRDKYNDSKLWIVRRTKCRHYSLEQRIEYTTLNGDTVSYRSGFNARTSLRSIQSILKWIAIETLINIAKRLPAHQWETAWEDYHHAEQDMRYYRHGKRYDQAAMRSAQAVNWMHAMDAEFTEKLFPEVYNVRRAA